MRTVPGGVYRVRLQLLNSERLNATWLVGAVGATYPSADLAVIESYGPASATLLLRWRRGYGDINIGDKVTPVAEGLRLPGAGLPSGVVESVEVVELPVEPITGYGMAAKVGLAAGLILVTALLSMKIGRKHGNTG